MPCSRLARLPPAVPEVGLLVDVEALHAAVAGLRVARVALAEAAVAAKAGRAGSADRAVGGVPEGKKKQQGRVLGYINWVNCISGTGRVLTGGLLT